MFQNLSWKWLRKSDLVLQEDALRAVQRCHSKDPSLLSSLFTNNWKFLCIEICLSNGHLHLVIQVIVLLASVQYKCICRCRMPILNYLPGIHMRRFKCAPLTIVLNMNVSRATLCHPLPPNALPACTPCGNTPAPNLVNQEPGVLSCMWSTCGVATIIICWTILTSKCVLVCSDRSWALLHRVWSSIDLQRENYFFQFFSSIFTQPIFS